MLRTFLTCHIISSWDYFLLVTGSALKDNCFRETVEYNDVVSYDIDEF